MRVACLNEDERTCLQDYFVAVDDCDAGARRHVEPLVNSAMSIIGPPSVAPGRSTVAAPCDVLFPTETQNPWVNFNCSYFIGVDTQPARKTPGGSLIEGKTCSATRSGAQRGGHHRDPSRQLRPRKPTMAPLNATNKL